VTSFPLKVLAGVGAFAREQWDELRHAAAVIGTVLYTAVRPRSWARAARTAFARQVLAIGVEPVAFVCAVAVFVGISVVVQLTFWVGQAGQSQRPHVRLSVGLTSVADGTAAEAAAAAGRAGRLLV
jgi:hypothetical protein